MAKIKRRCGHLTEPASDGWDNFAPAVGMGRAPYATLMEALGLYLAEHQGKMWKMTEAEQRELVRRAHDIYFERLRR